MKNTVKVCKIVIFAIIIGLFSASLAAAAEETVSGTIENSDNGIVLSTDNGDQFVIKGEDASNLVGKSVKVTGTLTEDEAVKTIDVTSIEVVSEMEPEPKP